MVDCRKGGLLRADAGSVAVEASLNALDLAGAEHEHRVVVGVVHVVHEQIAVRAVVAAQVREGGLAEVVVGLVRRVVDEVVAVAATPIIAPDVAQVEPVADLVRGRAAEVERHRCRAHGAEAAVQNDHAIGGGRAAGELRVAEQAVAELADPQVQVLVARPGVGTAGGGRLHLVVVTERVGRRLRARDAGRGGAVRVFVGHHELDARVGGQRLERLRDRGDVAVGLAEVAVQHRDLARNLRVGDVLRWQLEDHVHDHRDDGDAGARVDAAHRAKVEVVVLADDAQPRVLGVGAQQPLVNGHRAATASERRGRKLVGSSRGGGGHEAISLRVGGALFAQCHAVGTERCGGEGTFVQGRAFDLQFPVRVE